MPNARSRSLVFKNEEVTIYTDVIDALDTGKPTKRYKVEFTTGSGEWRLMSTRHLFKKQDVIDYVIYALQKYSTDYINCIYKVAPEAHERKYKSLLRNI